MITYNSPSQLSIEEFRTPFELKLKSTNRWVKLSSLLPWDKLANVYLCCLDNKMGRPSIDARIVIGSLVIKHKLKLSDRETIDMICENPYMQYFLGLNEFQPEPLFDPSLFVELRKRMGNLEFDKLNKIIIEESLEEETPVKESNRKKDENDPSAKSSGASHTEGNEKPNQGSLKIDATVADQYIKYPTDLDLLNDSREWCEKIIDTLYEKSDLPKKPRTYRREARRDYLAIAKKKHRTEKEIRKGIKFQLGYLRRDFKYIDNMLDMFEDKEFPLSRREQRYLFVIRTVFEQQKYMYENKTHVCPHRIVSLHQPHVRPIVRGKQKAPVEFGAKLGLSLDNGYARIDRLSWDAYNECGDLQTQVEAYKTIHGHYPELVQADKIYATRENRKYLNERGIRLTAKPLGRPPAEEETYYQKRKKKKEYNERNQIEGKFGQGKNGYRMNQIRARLMSTSESWIACIIFVMNLIKFEKDFLFVFYKNLLSGHFFYFYRSEPRVSLKFTV